MISHELSTQKFKEMMNEGVVVDVRTLDEFKEGKIGKPFLIDFYDQDFTKKLLELDKEKTYLLYCRTGGRSLSALNFMKENGFENIYHLTGGIEAWNEEFL